jgi:hypothetical protein
MEVKRKGAGGKWLEDAGRPFWVISWVGGLTVFGVKNGTREKTKQCR